MLFHHKNSGAPIQCGIIEAQTGCSFMLDFSCKTLDGSTSLAAN